MITAPLPAELRQSFHVSHVQYLFVAIWAVVTAFLVYIAWKLGKRSKW